MTSNPKVWKWLPCVALALVGCGTETEPVGACGNGVDDDDPSACFTASEPIAATGGPTAVVVADFDNVNDWRAFREHPAHLLLMEELIKGKFKNRAAIQYQTPAARDPFAYSEARMQELLAEPDELG